MYRLAPILISGQFDKYFTFMLLALHNGTTVQLQICSSERNVPLLPVDWKTKGATNPIDWNKHKNTLLNHLMISHGIYT